MTTAVKAAGRPPEGVDGLGTPATLPEPGAGVYLHAERRQWFADDDDLDLADFDDYLLADWLAQALDRLHDGRITGQHAETLIGRDCLRRALRDAP